MARIPANILRTLAEAVRTAARDAEAGVGTFVPAGAAATVRADDLFSRGATYRDIWHDLNVYGGPDTIRIRPGVRSGRPVWLDEIDDSGLEINPSGVEEAVQHQYGSMPFGGADGLFRLPPQLTRRFPALAEVDSQYFPGGYAGYMPPQGRRSPERFAFGVDTLTGPRAPQLAAHEAQHRFMNIAGAPGGTAPKYQRADPKFRDRLAEALRATRNQYDGQWRLSGDQKALAAADYADTMIRNLRALPQEAVDELSRVRLYLDDPGEKVARYAEERLRLTPAQRRDLFPEDTPDTFVAQEWNSILARALGMAGAAGGLGLSISAAREALAQALAEERI